MTDVQITRLPHGKDLPLPAYQSELAAGMDLLAAVALSLIHISEPTRLATISFCVVGG